MQFTYFAGIGRRRSKGFLFEVIALNRPWGLRQQRLLDFSVGVTRQRIATESDTSIRDFCAERLYFSLENENLGTAVVQQKFHVGLTLARSDRNDDDAAKIAGEKLPAIAKKDRDAITARDSSPCSRD
jgi:hypothetical protein